MRRRERKAELRGTALVNRIVKRQGMKPLPDLRDVTRRRQFPPCFRQVVSVWCREETLIRCHGTAKLRTIPSEGSVTPYREGPVPYRCSALAHYAPYYGSYKTRGFTRSRSIHTPLFKTGVPVGSTHPFALPFAWDAQQAAASSGAAALPTRRRPGSLHILIQWRDGAWL